MADILNVPRACNTRRLNTGASKGCVVTFNEMIGVILCFDGFKIPSASRTDWATTLAYLQEAAMNPDPKKRIYPILKAEFTDNTEAADVKKDGVGFINAVFEKPFTAEVIPENLGVEFFKNLRGFTHPSVNKNVRAYIVTDEFIGGHADSAGDFLPYEAAFMSKGMKGGKRTGDQTKYMFDLSLKNPKALTDLLNTISYPEDVVMEDELSGLIDVVLTATGGSGTITLKAVEVASKESFVSKYAAELELGHIYIDGVANTDAISISGDTITISSVTAGTYKVKLAPASVLVADGIGSKSMGGYESDEVTVTVTA